MHLLFLTDNFPPEVNAPASRTFEHCREWVGAGCKVTVITCAPNFPKGKVYEGYRNKIWQTEELSGITVIRVWTYITANEGFAGRIFDYVSFVPPAVLASLFVKKPDLVIGTSPQFFTVCAAYCVSRLKSIPFVFELRDIWPESVKAVGAMEDSAVIRFFERIEMFLYRKAAQIISVTSSFKKRLIERGVDGRKIEVVTNGVDLARYTPRPKDEKLVRQYDLEGKFIAGYIGTHGMAHALETLLDAAKKMSELEEGRDFRLILLGHGAGKRHLVEYAAEKGLENVLFIDTVPKEEVVRYWSILDVAVIHLKNTPLFKTVIPSKLFECMGMGIPVVHGVAGESAEIVNHCECGLTFEPENSDQLVEKLLLMKSDQAFYCKMRERCLSGAKSFNRAHLAGKMLKILGRSLEKS